MAGHKWHTYLCAAEGIDPIQKFRDEVKAHFHGSLKPRALSLSVIYDRDRTDKGTAFNVEDRAKAGLSGGYYENLVSKTATVEDSRHIERAAAGG